MSTYRVYAWRLFLAFQTGKLTRPEYRALAFALASQRHSWRYN